MVFFVIGGVFGIEKQKWAISRPNLRKLHFYSTSYSASTGIWASTTRIKLLFLLLGSLSLR